MSAGRSEVVLVTDRDRVVAELGPPRPGRGAFANDAQLAEVVRKGWLTPPVLPPGNTPPRQPVARFAETMAELDRDRAER